MESSSFTSGDLERADRPFCKEVNLSLRRNEAPGNTGTQQQEFDWATADQNSQPSTLQERFALIDRLPLRSGKFSRGDRKLLKVLAEFAFACDGDGTLCDPSFSELQRLLECRRETIAQRIRRCEAAGFIDVERDRQSRTPNIYPIKWLEIVDAANRKPFAKVVRNRTTQESLHVNVICNENIHVENSNFEKKKNSTGGWDHKLKLDDFKNPEAVELLYQTAVNRFKLPKNDRELVYAAAVRCRRGNTPGKLFTWLIKGREREELSDDDWKEGKQMIREFDEKHRPKNAQEYQQVFGTTESPRDREQDYEAELETEFGPVLDLLSDSERNDLITQVFDSFNQKMIRRYLRLKDQIPKHHRQQVLRRLAEGQLSATTNQEKPA